MYRTIAVSAAFNSVTDKCPDSSGEDFLTLFRMYHTKRKIQATSAFNSIQLDRFPNSLSITSLDTEFELFVTANDSTSNLSFFIAGSSTDTSSDMSCSGHSSSDFQR